MSDSLDIRINATDNASKVFSSVGKSATTMGDAIEAAGKDGAKSFKEVGTAAEQNAGKFSKLKAEATLLGGAIGTVGSAMALLGNSAKEQERLTDAIGRAYGDAGDEMIEFSDHIQDTTRFSNDAVQSALLFGTSLANNYGLATDQIQQLTSTAADMAQIFGISLPDAMSRLSGAIRGEGEAAELLGLNMSDAAVAAAALEAGITNWGVPGALSEAEKGAFRFSLLMEQTAFANGAAAEAADNAGGKFRQLANEFQDVGQDVGAFLGPVGQVAAELSPVAIALPVIGAGLGKLSTAAKGSTLAMSALGVATNPVVLGIVALTAAAGAGYLIYQKMGEGQRKLAESFDDTRDAIQRLKDEGFTGLATEIENLSRQFPNLAESGNTAAKALTDSFGGVWEEGSVWNQELGAFVTEADASLVALAEGMNSSAEDVTAANAKITEALTSGTVDIAAFTAEVQRLFAEMMADPGDAKGEGWFLDQVAAIDLSNYQKQADIVIDANGEMLASLEELNSAFAEVGDLTRELRFEGMDDAAADIEAVSTAFSSLNGPISGAVIAYGDLSQAGTLTAESLKDAAYATNQINEALASGDYDNASIMAEYFRILSDPSLDPNEKAQAIFDLGIAVNTTNQYLLETGSAAGLAAGVINAVGAAAQAGAASIAALNEKQAFLNQTAIAFIANGDNILAFLVEMDSDLAGATTGSGKFAASMLSSADATLLLSYHLDEASDALDQVLATFDQIDALGARASAAGSIADALIGAPGELGTLQDLWARIAEGTSNATLEQIDYDNAIKAGIAIQESNLNIQDDLTVIRAKQIPLLAEQTAAYEQYIHQLSLASAEEQQHALYLSDSANQSKIAELASVAYAASIGEIPMEAATDIFLNAAQADPILADLLEKYGYIERDVNGKISVTIPEGESTLDVLTRIDQSIRNLVYLLDDDPLTIPIYAEDEASAEFDAIEAKLSTLQESEPTYLGVVADDQVTGPVEAMRRALGAEPVVVPVEAEDNTEPVISDINAIKMPDLVVPIEPEDNVGETLSFYSNHPEIVIPVIIGRPGHDSSAPSLDVDSQTVTITTELDDQASEGLASIQSLAESLDGLTSVFVAELDDDATRPIEDVTRLHESHDGDVATLVIDLRDNATGDIDAIARRHRNIDGDVSTLKINANAADAEGDVQWARNLNGDVLATSYINIVTRYFDGGSGPGHQRMGGIVGLATGGLVPVELAEAGPEMLHFANGGMMPVFERGLYAAPAGTYVSPAPSAASFMGGGTTVIVNVQGDVYGIDDLKQQVGDELLGVVVDILRDYRVSSGAN